MQAGGATPPAQAGSATQPAQAGNATPPAQAGNATKPPRRSGRRLQDRSDSGLLAEIRRVADLVDRPVLRKGDFDRVSLLTSARIARRLGGWGAALAKAGLAQRYGGAVITESMRTKPLRGLTDRQMLDRLRRAATRDGVVTQQAVRRKFGHHCDAYTGRFGSWRTAVWKAGLRLSPKAACDPRRKRTPEEKHQVSVRLRFAVLKRDDYRCLLCGDSPAISKGTTLEVDHIHPFSQGGRTTEDNLRTLCRRCNQGKGARG
ncbi:MAG: HNH endonuclease [Rhodospirillaceae bacterium]|nr:HNH endonuclease [Rhodospirillaceae bacterium]